jgi:CDP-Glycerol:Poly(glycerophosphate) glycerophosphotransferase
MKGRRILIFSRDPGGTNAIMPLIEPLRALGNEVSVYGKDAALSIYRKQNIDCSDICNTILSDTQEEADEFLRKTHPNLIVTGTSSEDFTERHLWKAAERAEITSFAVLDQWTNYRLRLISEGSDPMNERATSELILPSFFFIMDEFARKEMCALGIDREKLVVSGQPFFDYIRKTGDGLTTQEIEKLRQELTGAEDGRVFVFASQPIRSIHRKNGMAEDYWGYTEESVLKSVLKCLSKLAEEMATKVTLVLRLHPKDESHVYEDALSTLPSLIKVVVDKETDSSLLLKASDLIIGMFSMLLLEAAILERRFISVQIGLKRENPLVFDRMGLVRSIVTEQELEETLRRILSGKDKEFPNLNFEFGATERITNYLEAYR